MGTRRQFTRLGIAAVAAAATVAAVPAAAPASTSGPYCGIWWGSTATSAPTQTTGTLTDVRSGRHACFDRLVLDVDDVPGTLGYSVRYVNSVRADGSGARVPLRGGADLQVVLRAPAHTNHGVPTYQPSHPRYLVDVTNYRTFRQVAWAGSFEGQTTIGLGVRARLPFRTFVLDGPGDGARLVIDVAHRW